MSIFDSEGRLINGGTQLGAGDTGTGGTQLRGDNTPHGVYIEYINKVEKTLDEKLRNFEKKFIDDIDKLGNKAKKVEEKIEASNNQSFAILAIFTTVFTFISVHVNILNNSELTYSRVAFLMFLNGILSALIVSIPILILQSFSPKNYTPETKSILWKILSIALFIFIIIIVFTVAFDVALNMSTRTNGGI